MVRRSFLYLSIDERIGHRRDRVSADRRQVKGPFTTPMRRSQLCADPNRRHANPSGQTACMVLRLRCIVLGTRSLGPAPRQRLVISCVRRWPSSSRDCSSALNSRRAPQTLALERVDRNCQPSGSRTACRERQQDMEIARCVARPCARENYVEVWLATNGHSPRKSSATRLERSSSAHSCDLCIGVGSDPSQPTKAVTGQLAPMTRAEAAFGWQPSRRSWGAAVTRSHGQRRSGSGGCRHWATETD